MHCWVLGYAQGAVIRVACKDAFAGKPAPTVDLWFAEDVINGEYSCGSGLAGDLTAQQSFPPQLYTHKFALYAGIHALFMGILDTSLYPRPLSC
ncbi:hypothetical protein SAMN04489798_2635 [Pseudomonas arsenicoxydans]|uniref:Uncharacterized protein n=1 Tax=Pseudomonas arsenicoxydans TaxID=702115 RepID=A0A1H0IJH4_9PSED|nr:hypothetical protein SAMN04489798_2635 [Pseudomonas arsenicoxydans]